MSSASPTLGNAFLALFKRDFRLAFLNRGELLNPILFFLIVVTLFPFGIGSDPNQLQLVAPGIIWVAALLATLLGLDGLFKSDYEDGSLEQIVLSPHPLAVLVLAKIIVHWLLTGLPLILIAPLISLLLNLSTDLIPIMLLSLLIGTPSLSLIGSIGVALTSGIQKGGLLLTLLVLPLYIPILIFGVNLIQAESAGLDISGQIYILTAIFFFTLTLSPLATAAALKISLN